jgi:hypothetical protein
MTIIKRTGYERIIFCECYMKTDPNGTVRLRRAVARFVISLVISPVRTSDEEAGGDRYHVQSHQIINTSEEELRFLAVSTKLSPEIAEYPDTNRFGVLASLAPDETGRPRTMMYVGKEGDSLYYWEGE